MNLADLLFGERKIELGEPQPQYGEAIQSYLDGLENQSYFKDLLNRPSQTGLTPEQYKIGITQGLNYGVPEIAQAQQQLGIKIPVTGEDKYNASIGEFNKYPVIRAGISGTPREGGLLNDLAQGFRDNYNNRFSFNNLAPQGKNWATRIGEGLGTVGRFIDSPLGRGLIAGGLNSALGYNNSLQEGLNAAVGRQKARTADSIYRKQLKQMGYTDEDLYNIVGDVTPEIYKGLTDSFRLGNQRMTYGQLALFDPEIAEQVRQNPELANQFMPVMFARDIYGKKNQQAEANIEKIKADTEGSKARTEKTKAETGQVGKPRVTINRREGGTTSRVIMEHKGGSGKGGKNTNTQTNQKNVIVSKLKNAGYSDAQIQQYLKAKGYK